MKTTHRKRGNPELRVFGNSPSGRTRSSIPTLKQIRAFLEHFDLSREDLAAVFRAEHQLVGKGSAEALVRTILGWAHESAKVKTEFSAPASEVLELWAHFTRSIVTSSRPPDARARVPSHAQETIDSDKGPAASLGQPSWKEIETIIRKAEGGIIRAGDALCLRLQPLVDRLLAIRGTISDTERVRLLKHLAMLLRPILSWDAQLSDGLSPEQLRRARRVHTEATFSDDLAFVLTPPADDELGDDIPPTGFNQILTRHVGDSDSRSDLTSPALEGTVSELQALRLRLQGLDPSVADPASAQPAISALSQAVAGMGSDLSELSKRIGKPDSRTPKR